MNILLNTTKKIVPIEKISMLNSVWFWIALLELALIIFLIFRLKSKKNKLGLSEMETNQIKESKGANIDMDNLINSIHNSKNLYKELSKKCHPDRFINNPLQKNAEEIFQEITKNERNFEKLSKLKERAISELNINF